MNKLIYLLVLIVFTGCSQKQEILVTKKVYPDISKNAIFNATKTLLNLSNENNQDKSFIVDSYRDKIEISKIIFKDNIINVEVILDKWLLELYQTDTETRANLIFVRRDGIDLDDVKDIDKNVHELFWDRLDYLLGLKKDWKQCSSYFSFIKVKNSFCNNYFITSAPLSDKIEKDILISKENIKINTIDSVNADILIQTDLTLTKKSKDIFNQSEDIENTNMLEPITTDDIFEVEAEKKERIKKTENKDENVGIEDLKEGELLDVNKQMNKFKEDLENIINKKPQLNDTDSNKIILDSNMLKENSEFDLKSKEKNK